MANKTGSHKQLRCLCEGAILLALAEILSFLPLYRMAWGGSIDLAMLPIFLFCARWGFGPGMLVSFAHGILQILLEGGGFAAVGWQSVIGDYIVAYTVLGFAGLFHKFKHGFTYGTLVGGFLRFLVHYVVGATIWAEYMPEEFFGLTMTTPWFYSFLYNGFYMFIDMAAILIIGAVLLRTPLAKYVRGEDVR